MGLCLSMQRFSPPSLRSIFLWLWLPLKDSNEVGNLHTPFGIEGFQRRIDAEWLERESPKQEKCFGVV